ncbi:Uncharacterised protein [Listeria grayi]|nr:Uncharacterised protein [Listeria grayi]
MNWINISSQVIISPQNITLDYKFFFNKKPSTYKIRYAIFYKGEHLSTITSNEFKVIK